MSTSIFPQFVQSRAEAGDPRHRVEKLPVVLRWEETLNFFLDILLTLKAIYGEILPKMFFKPGFLFDRNFTRPQDTEAPKPVTLKIRGFITLITSGRGRSRADTGSP